MINLRKLFTSCCFLLTACQPPVKEEQTPVKHQLHQWKLLSQGQDNWSLEAQSASEYNQRWKLDTFRWLNPSRGLVLSASKAFQSNMDWIQIPEFKFHIQDFSGSGFKGQLHLKSMAFSGTDLQVQSKQSELQAESFKSEDLKTWQLQKVHMRFQRP